MKRFIVTLALFALSGFAAAQPSTLEFTIGDIQANRAKISAVRIRLEAGFQAEDLACHEKFFVNSCLDKVDSRRSVGLAELRRQELALNDEERKIRGEQAMRRLAEKSSPENLRQAADQRAKGAEDYQLRLAREKDKQQGRAAASASEKAARDASAQHLLEIKRKAQARADRKSSAAEEARKFDERQQQAAERRAQHEKEQLARPQPTGKPLPLPN